MYIFVDIDHKEAVELMTDVTTIDTVFYEDIETGNIEVAKYINWSFNPQGEGNFIGDYLFLRRISFDMYIKEFIIKHKDLVGEMGGGHIFEINPISSSLDRVAKGLKTVAKSGYKVGDL